MRGLLIATGLMLLSQVALADPAEFTAPVKGSDGADLGKFVLQEGPAGVLIRYDLHVMKPGGHGAHVDEKLEHGFLNPKGTHSGDLPNIYVAADGTVLADTFTTFVSLHGEKNRPGLLDADGTALVIHENPDDYTHPPIGGAGARIACAVIK